MNILTIPMRNMRRKPAKTLLLLFVFSMGVMSIVALFEVSRVVGESLERKLTAFGANIVISPKTEALSLSYGGFHMGDMLLDVPNLAETKTADAIRNIELNERISAVAPKLVTLASVKESAVAVVGINWDQEQRIKSYWAVDGAFSGQETELLVGSRAAEQLGLKNGDVVSLFDQQFTVAATLYETGSEDDGVIFMGLPRLQQLLGRSDSTSYIEVSALCSGCPIEDIVAQIQSALPGAKVSALRHVVVQRMASVHFVQQLALAVSLIILITAVCMVGLSMLSAVNERKKDIGILRSLGYGKRQVFFIFCIEAGCVGGLAGFIGYFAGFGASFHVLEFLNLTAGTVPAFSSLHLFASMMIFTIITVVAASYPALKGARIEPSRVLVAL